MIKYRGKYPNKIESKWIITHKHFDKHLANTDQAHFAPSVYVRTNSGKIYKTNIDYFMWRGDFIIDQKDIDSGDFVFVEQSTKRS